MIPDILDSSIADLIGTRAETLETLLSSDVVFYSGSIFPGYFMYFRNFIEEVRFHSTGVRDSISVVLRTSGGSLETTERMVAVLRQHYNRVNFVVPDVAMSAGTIMCMSGDNIYMDYASSLGPIDPQVPAPGTSDWVPAMGYIDKVEEIIGKGNAFSPADVVLLKSIDLAKLALFEQARDLSIDLLKKWLVEYKFSNWTKHRTNGPGSPVTLAEKEKRAKEIAQELANHKRWRSHGRNLDIVKLRELRIEIEDYSRDEPLRRAIREYSDLLSGYVDRMQLPLYMHNRHVAF